MKYLLLFSQINLEFRVAEIEGICKALNISFDLTLIDEKKPIYVIELENDFVIRQILTRSVLLKTAYEFFAVGNSYEELHQRVKEDLAVFEQYNSADQSWAIRVRPVGRKRNVNVTIRPREFCEYIPLGNAPVSMKSPTNKFVLLEHYFTETSPEPEMIYFLREIADGRCDLKVKINLSERCYIGNTTMDPELAIIQSNITAISPKSFVLDPFCGTGGLLVPAAEFGAIVVGTEINYQVAHGQGKSARHSQKNLTANESVAANFKQYGSFDNFLSLLVADTSRHGLWVERPLFDAIVADPPYGIREKGRKIGPKERKEHWTLPGHENHQHFPEKQVYELDSVFCDLIDLASRTLVIGGRVSFWFPCILETYSEEVLPAHPAFKLISNCEQVLTLKTSRRLLTYEKIRERKEGEFAQTAHNQYEDKTFRDAVFRIKKDQQED